MSDHSRQQAERTKQKTNRASAALDDDVLLREAKDFHRWSFFKRAWSFEGTKHVHGWTRDLLAEIAPTIRAIHCDQHRCSRTRGPVKLCVARDLYACFLLTFRPAGRPRSMPYKDLLLKRIATLLLIKITRSQHFHRAVARDLSNLLAALSVPGKEPTNAEGRLIARYPAASRLADQSRNLGQRSIRL
jgi:hypothetical protein